MKQEKLSKLKVDIDYIDPVTMQKTCSFNQCIHKFTDTGTEEIVTYPKWKGGEKHIRISNFHSCVDCGRRHISKGDKKKNISDALAAAAGQGQE